MESVDSYVNEMHEVLELLPRAEIARAVGILAQARYRGSRVFIFGNGGSAATASHFTCDLAKGTIEEGKPRFKVWDLTSNQSLFSALANDWGYACIFAEQLESLAEPGDVAIAISGSGNSENVLKAIDVAGEKGLTTIGIVGFDGGQLISRVDLTILVPSDCMERIEDAHLIVAHAISTSLHKC